MRASRPGRFSSVGAEPDLKMARRMELLIRRSRNPILACNGVVVGLLRSVHVEVLCTRWEGAFCEGDVCPDEPQLFRTLPFTYQQTNLKLHATDLASARGSRLMKRNRCRLGDEAFLLTCS